ncbi:DNA-binding HxlR family transcriptional regulator [Nocardiopsis mwathae]|uniref:DNA-binding HxlR family transcriptional regulator n=1 Tax=Nocardiopsis mwathae TaxID=1472723 RepID=A0A7X0D4U4_9ACTN|nr:helix-turn-helix domain-containing protein [Nocardiopsis mwathae]MBB6171677.1 DNA-binding HxlR family transcriptional regulator [Nocardiopsis mwathae]
MPQPRDCSVARTLEVVGERWSLLVLREVFLGVRRFDRIHEHTGAPRAVLTERLRRLVEAGILRRTEYRDQGARPRNEYELTHAGRELRPVLTALMQWGDRHLAGPEGPPLQLRHADCGGRISTTLNCEYGHRIPDTGEGLRAVPREPAQPGAQMGDPQDRRKQQDSEGTSAE